MTDLAGPGRADAERSQREHEVVAAEMAAHAPEPLDPDDYGRSGVPGERAVEGAPFVRPLRLLGLAAFFALIFTLAGCRWSWSSRRCSS